MRDFRNSFSWTSRSVHRGHGPRSPQLGVTGRRKFQSRNNRFCYRKLDHCDDLVKRCINFLLKNVRVERGDSTATVARQIGYIIKHQLDVCREFLKDGLRPLKCFSKNVGGKLCLHIKFLWNSNVLVAVVPEET